MAKDKDELDIWEDEDNDDDDVKKKKKDKKNKKKDKKDKKKKEGKEDKKDKKKKKDKKDKKKDKKNKEDKKDKKKKRLKVDEMVKILSTIAERVINEDKPRCAIELVELQEFAGYKKFSSKYTLEVAKELKNKKILMAQMEGFIILEMKKTVKLKKVSAKVLIKAKNSLE